MQLVLPPSEIPLNRHRGSRPRSGGDHCLQASSMMDLGRTSVSGTPELGPEDFAGPGCSPLLGPILLLHKVLLLHNFSAATVPIKMVQNLPQVFLLLLLPCQLWAQPSPECPRVTKEHTNCLDRSKILSLLLLLLQGVQELQGSC